jgi:hypothetical protein
MLWKAALGAAFLLGRDRNSVDAALHTAKCCHANKDVVSGILYTLHVLERLGRRLRPRNRREKDVQDRRYRPFAREHFVRSPFGWYRPPAFDQCRNRHPQRRCSTHRPLSTAETPVPQAGFSFHSQESKLTFREWLRIFSEPFFCAPIARAPKLFSQSKVGCVNFTHCDAIPLKLGIPNKSTAEILWPTEV